MNDEQHSIRVVTELWNSMEGRRTTKNSADVSKAQKLLIDCAFERFRIVDSADRTKRGIRVPVLEPMQELIDAAKEKTG